jgi:hypothetical protein
MDMIIKSHRRIDDLFRNYLSVESQKIQAWCKGHQAFCHKDTKKSLSLLWNSAVAYVKKRKILSEALRFWDFVAEGCYIQ